MQTQDYREEQFETRAHERVPEVGEAGQEAPQERRPDTDGLLSDQEVNELVWAAQKISGVKEVRVHILPTSIYGMG